MKPENIECQGVDVKGCRNGCLVLSIYFALLLAIILIVTL